MLSLRTSTDVLIPRLIGWSLLNLGKESFFRDSLVRTFIPPGRPEGYNVVLLGGLCHELLGHGLQDCPDGFYRFWTLSRASRRLAIELIGLPALSVGIIPRQGLFPNIIRTRPLPDPRGGWTVVYSGRLSFSRGFDRVLRTVCALQRSARQRYGSNADIRFLCFGDFDSIGQEDHGVPFIPDAEARLRALVGKLPWVFEPEFLGSKAPDEWHQTSILNPVLISLSTFYMDDFGVSVAQAQSFGWPCILSDWGGQADATGGLVILLSPSILDNPAVAAEFILENLDRALKGQEFTLPEPPQVLPSDPSSLKSILRVLTRSRGTHHWPTPSERYRDNFGRWAIRPRGLQFFNRYRQLFSGQSSAASESMP